MKRLITFLFLLICSSAVIGQTTITIGTQVVQSGTSGIGPTNYYWESRRMQWVMTAAEITAAGGYAGDITSIAYDVSQIAGGDLVNYEVKMAHTTATDAAVHNTSALTTVYTTTAFVPGATGWRTITLTTPFSWNGTSNILFDVCWGVNPAWTSTGQVWLYNNVVNQMIGTFSSSINQCSLNTSTTRSGKPRMQMTFLSTEDMAISSFTTETASSAPVLNGSIDQQVIRLKVVTTGALNPISITSVDFTTGGTTNTLDLTSAKVYYTNSTTFSTTIPFGTAISNPSGTLVFTGSQALATGNNYFWLAYDISATATQWNVVDGTCTQFNTNETVRTTYVPTVTDPVGSRTIRYALAGTYTIDNTNPTGGTNYNNFTDALNDLNNLGHSAAVTFNVFAGQSWSATVPAAPYNYAYLVMNYIGSAANPVVFQKSGTGANPVLNITGTVATNDIGFYLYGCDYVTFNAIDVSDAGTVANDYLDYGFQFYGPANNSCQYVTIQNCTIDLNKNNTSSRGIYTATNAPTAASGVNHHNTFTGNTIQDTYIAIYQVGSSTYYDDYNTISGNIIQNLGNNLAITIYGIYSYYQTNLTVAENAISNVTGASTTYGMYFLGPNNTASIYMNNISALTGTSTSSPVYGCYISSGSSYNFFGNQLYAIAGNATACGLYISSATTSSIYRNSFYDISRSGTSSSYYVYGMYIGGGTTHNINNNYIYNLRAPLALSSTTSASVRGMSLSGGTTLNVYYNTVYLDYVVDASATSNQSAALYVTASPGTVDLRNNIFVNNTDMSAGGQRAVAFYKTTAVYTNIGSNSNNNLYFCGTLGGTPTNLIFYDGANSDQTLAAYKARVAPRDASAVTENPPFASASDPYDLHLQTGISTQCESGGTTSSVVDDYDGDARYPNSGYPDDFDYPATAPDIGADEFAGQPLDLVGPNISYTPLTTSTSTTTLAFTNVSITDVSGVNITTGTRPRVYYKKSTNANSLGGTNDATTDGWKWKEANGTNDSPFDFTIDYSLLFGGPLIIGDIIQYFVVAQDLAVPTVSINQGAFAAQPASVALTGAAFPIGGTINSYSIAGSISGTFNIGPGQTYRCLTADADTGFFKAVNNKVVTGNIVLNIMGNLNETGAVALNQFAEEPFGSNYTITIQPDAATSAPLTTMKTISGTYSGGLIRLNGADRVTFDGRVGGSGNFLTFSNTSTAANSAVFHLISLGTGTGATNITIRNCNISAGSNSVTSTFGIHAGGASVSTTGTGADNDNLSIVENVITKAYYAVYARGVSGIGLLDNLFITGNTIGSDLAADYVTYRGVDIQSASGPVISQNKIFNLQLATAVSNAGIDMGQYVTDALVSRNEIHGLRSTSTGGWGTYGINISSSTGTSNININNNLIYDLITDGDGTSTTYNPFGIRITGGTGHKVYYNSVNLYGAFTNLTTADYSAAFVITSNTATGTDLRDNIFSNTMTGGTGTKCFSAYVVSGTTFGTIDYNDYYVSGSNGVFGFYGADIADLAAWKLASGQDVNSISSDPLYLANDDLNIPANSPAVDTGTPITTVDYDFDGLDRDDTSPNMGAYESFLSVSCPWPVNLRDTLVTAYTAVLKWNPGGAETQWRVKWGESGFDPDTEGTYTVILVEDTLLLTGLAPFTQYQWYVRAICGEADSSILVGPDGFQTLCGAYNTFPYTHNFDNQTIGGSTSACTGNTLAPLGYCWAQETTVDNINWNVATGVTGSLDTGPDFDHTTGTTGKYLYTESSSCYNVDGWIYTPEFNFTGVFPTMSFWYHMYGATMGTLSVQASTDGGTTWSSDLWSLSGDQGNQWVQANVVISQYANEPSVKFRFIGLTGTSFTSDMAIDDFMVDVVTDPLFNATPTAMNYGECPLNNLSDEYYTRSFTVQNAGPDTLKINGSSLAGLDASQFVLTDTNTYPKGLTGSQTLTVSVKFEPDAVGDKTAALRFTTPAKADHDIALTGSAFVYPPQNFTGETTLTYTNQLDWDPPRPEGEMRYDNGIASAFYGFTNATPSNYFFTRFTAPVNGNLDWIGIFCEANTVGTQWNKIMVCPELGTTNEPDLANPVVTYPDVPVNSTTGVWILLELNTPEALVSGEDFFIVTNWKTSTTGPWVGTDGTNNYSRCFWASDGGVLWNDIEASFIMRAYMSTSKSSYMLSSGIPNPSLAFLPQLSLDDPSEDSGREKTARIPVPGVYEPNSGRALVSYTVLRGAAANALAEHQPGVTETEYEDISVLPGTQYFYGVMAEYSNSQFSDTTNVISLTTLVLPTAPDTPHPADLAVDVSPDDSLTWVNHGNVQYVDLYFSQTQSEVVGKDAEAKVLDNVAVTNHYNPAGLMAEGTWYWRAVVRDGVETEVDGPVWSFTVADILGPEILPDLLPLKTANTEAKTITATITDLSGVPSEGDGLPQLYWKIGVAGTYQGVQSNPPENNVFTFSNVAEGYPLGAGDTIYYFIAAQDVVPTPNVSVVPSAGAAGLTDTPPAATTPPTSPYYCAIVEGLSGEYTISTAKADFTSITGLNGLFDKINKNVVVGDITATVESNITETWLTGLNPVTYEGAAHWNLTVTTNGTYTVTGSTSGGLIRLLGADYVTFDGNNRQLTLENTNSVGTCHGVVLTDNSKHNSIMDCKIKTYANSSTSYACIYASGTGIDSNMFAGNELTKAYYGIYLYGNSTIDGKNNVINSNTIGSAGDAATRIGNYGIYAYYQTMFEISGNEIFEMYANSVTYGMDVQYCNYTTIADNYIHNLAYTGTGGYGAVGIHLNVSEGTVTNPHLSIFNNVIRKISGDSDAPSSSYQWMPAGIRIFGSSSITAGIDLLYNSIYLERDTLYGLAHENNNWNACLVVDAGPTGINLANNILHNAMGKKNTSTYTPTFGYAIYVKGTTSPFAAIDYNIYFSENFTNNYVGLSGTAQPPVNNYNLAGWQTFTGQDAHSVFMNPNFQNNLLEFTGGSSYAIGGGTPLTTIITEDYDGDFRDEEHTTIGAHEYGWQAEWTNAATPDNNWFNGSNWSEGVFPWYNMTATIPTVPLSGALFPVIATGQTATVKTITVESNASVTVQAGGTLNVTEP